MKLTINSGLALQTAVRKRINELQPLRNSVAVETNTSYMGEVKSQTENKPQYDVKAVDAQIIKLERFLFELDSAIKTANARTELDIEADIDTLLAPLS